MTASLLISGSALALDHGYTAYGQLLSNNVTWVNAGHASVVDYSALKTRRAALQGVLKEWSAVSEAEFNSWSRERQMAFLINAYNGFTLELILTAYPDLKSIRDLGSLLRSPWKKPFFQLLGKEHYLDWIEQEQLRPRDHDPRVHFAINCASIGCPALRPEPYVAERLNEQLDDQQRRFLTDRSRNRFNASSGVLSTSAIFHWFGEDFGVADSGVKDWLAARADLLADNDNDRSRLRRGDFTLEHLSYNWLLNDQPRR